MKKEIFISGIIMNYEKRESKLASIVYCNDKGFMEKLFIRGFAEDDFGKFIIGLEEKIKFYKENEVKIVKEFLLNNFIKLNFNEILFIININPNYQLLINQKFY